MAIGLTVFETSRTVLTWGVYVWERRIAICELDCACTAAVIKSFCLCVTYLLILVYLNVVYDYSNFLTLVNLQSLSCVLIFLIFSELLNLETGRNNRRRRRHFTE